MAEVAELGSELVSYFKREREVILKRVFQALQAKGVLPGISTDELETEAGKGYDAFVECIETGKFDSAWAFSKAVAEKSIMAELTAEQTIMGLLGLRNMYERVIFENYGKDRQKYTRILDNFEPVANTLVSILFEVFVKEREGY